MCGFNCDMLTCVMLSSPRFPHSFHWVVGTHLRSLEFWEGMSGGGGNVKPRGLLWSSLFYLPHMWECVPVLGVWICVWCHRRSAHAISTACRLFFIQGNHNTAETALWEKWRLFPQYGKIIWRVFKLKLLVWLWPTQSFEFFLIIFLKLL